MDDNAQQNLIDDEQIDLAGDLFNIAVDVKLTTVANREAFDEFEKKMITYVYERLGLKDVPEKFKTFRQFVESFASTLMLNVQKDVEILNLRRRLSMISLASTIQKQGEKNEAEGAGQANPEA